MCSIYKAFARTWYRFFDRNARNAATSEEAERPVGADMTRQHPRMGIHWRAYCLRPRPHARPVDRVKGGVNLNPSCLSHALGRPTTALRPACPRVALARTTPAFRRNREISAWYQVSDRYQNRANPLLLSLLPPRAFACSHPSCVHSRPSPRHLRSLLKVLCAPKWNDFEFPIIKTTKLLVETRSGTWAKRI